MAELTHAGRGEARAAPRTAPVGGCPICAASGAPVFFVAKDRLHGTPGEFTYRRCATCRTVFQDPRVVPADLALCYPAEYGTHFIASEVGAASVVGPPGPKFRSRVRRALQGAVRGERPRGVAGWAGRALARRRSLRERSFAGLLDELLPPRPGSPRVLDVGCGAGELLVRLRAAGWEAEGVEWDPVAAEVARRHSGCPVRTGDFRAVALPTGGFDLLVLSHCFEHLDDPIGALTRIAELLAPGGSAVLLYPNPESLGARVFGPAWFNWDPPRHLVIPPGRTLAGAAERVGLRAARLRTAGRNARIDFKHSRAVRAGLTLERLRVPPESGWDAVAARVEAALCALGAGLGEEVILTLRKDD